MRLKTESRRLALVEAAKLVFLERGFTAASMSEIAQRVGGSKQTLYNYFQNKEELFVAVMLERGAVQLAPLFVSLRDERDLAAALERLGLTFLRFITHPESLAFRRIIQAEGARSRLGHLYFEAGPKRAWSRVAHLFSTVMDQGRMRRADPWTAAMHFQGLCEAGSFQRLLEGSIERLDEADLEAAVRDAVEVFTRGYEVSPVQAQA